MKRILTLMAVITLLLFGCGMDATQESTQTPTTTTAPPAISPTAVPATATPGPTALPSPTAAPSPTATLLPSPDDGSAWTTYHDADYGFSFRYPDERWEVVKLAHDPNLVSLTYHELGIALRVHFRRAGEEIILSYDAAGAPGDRIPSGTVIFIGEAIERTAVVYNDVEHQIEYDNARDILRGDLAFAIFLRSNRRRMEDKVLPVAVQAEADRIVETFELD